MSTWRCTIAGCNAVVDVGLVYLHLCIIHDYPFDCAIVETTCLCAGCRCSKQAPGRNGCPGRGVNHPWHGKDIISHIWKTHLDFRDVCHKCGEAGFTNTFTYNRHADSCAGRTPSRCRICWVEFPSKVALGGHVELGQCLGPPVGL
jgi:hypothetical protein